jgi:nucleoside-diphosphate-sugar epimerase
MNQSALSGARVLVIGASGCLGGRLVERLVECGAHVRVLVRRPASAASIARLPIEVMIGDVLDPHAVTTSAQGCAVVFNCARNREPDPMLQRAVDVDGAGHVVDAARRAGARVVHVSSVRVYDRPSEGVLDESTRPVPKGEDPPSDDKLEGEQIALARGVRDGVPVVVIQPAIVYGPNAHYSLEMLSDLRAGRVILVNGGVGICNVVYVDDAVTALFLAATNDRAHGERFLISGPEHPTWAQFVGAFEAMLGVQRTVSLSERDALCLWQRSSRWRSFVPEALRAIQSDPRLRERFLAASEAMAARRIATGLLPSSLVDALRAAVSVQDRPNADDELPIRALSPWVVRNRARQGRVSIEKAHRILGYTPVFTLSHGMGLTQQWARSAGLIRSGPLHQWPPSRHRAIS